MSLKAKIKAGAESLGFVSVGFTSVEPVPELQHYRNWIRNGQYAGMDYLASTRALETRSDPKKLLPSCKTVISLLSAYPPPSTLSMPEVAFGAAGKIAAYALLGDYHDVLRERLESLADLIGKLADSAVETYPGVDSAPILEKNYAQKAGLGWIGRNSLLLHPDYGSWLFLSELLVNLELEPDPPFEGDGCGNCQLCVRACPTQAIMPDRTVDASRCLSYLTIENRGQIPIEFRKAVGEHVFGCDQCQSVCPVNKKAFISHELAMIDEFPDLVESLALSVEDFAVKYRRNPVWRAKYAGFRRNVAIVMGNSGQKGIIPVLENALEDENDPIVAEAIRWALHELA